MKISKTSLVLLAIQLVIVGSIAVKYLYQRAHCPRVWVKTAMYDPEMFIRGRYMALQVTVDGCGVVEQVRAKTAKPKSSTEENFELEYGVQALPVKLSVEGDRLVAKALPEDVNRNEGERLWMRKGQPCTELTLGKPVDFFLAEHADLPQAKDAQHDLWVEVTIPPKGPPRPIQVEVRKNALWKPPVTK
jgi:uncharacterized membrane-anchored protein